MLPRNGSGLPAWRRWVMPWLMGGLRLAVVWAIFRGPVVFVWDPPAFLHLPIGLRSLFGLLLLVGLPLFLWPRRCWIGGLALAGAVGSYEWLWRTAGLPGGGMPLLAVGLIAVLVFGEWTARAARRRVYVAPDA